MDPKDYSPLKVLAHNVRLLMEGKHGPKSQVELAKKAGVSQSTIGRLLSGETATRVATMAAVAKVYELEAWQLLVAGMDPSNPPVLAPLSPEERSLYATLKSAALKIAELDSPGYSARPK